MKASDLPNFPCTMLALITLGFLFPPLWIIAYLVANIQVDVEDEEDD